MSRLFASLALVLVFGACDEDEPTPDPGGRCELGVLGDPDAPIDMRIVALGADRIAREVPEGGEVPMILPPQGGRVIFVGALATNVNACELELTGAVRDLTSGQLRIDGRTTNLSDWGGGWGGPVSGDISTFSNVPLCPNQWASSAVYDTHFELTISIEDGRGRTASRAIQIVPVCGEPGVDDECLCQCQQDYELGQPCP
jgi:hypothetical protein